MLPDREIPQRIAFVSDKVFEPSFFGGIWNSAAGWDSLSACVMAAALIVSAYHRPGGDPDRVQQRRQPHGRQLRSRSNDAVAKAVAQVRAEDAQADPGCCSKRRTET